MTRGRLVTTEDGHTIYKPYSRRPYALPLSTEERAAADRLVERRHMESRAALFRWYLECDEAGDLLHVDGAFRALAEYLAEGFGGAVAVMAARMDAAHADNQRVTR